MAATGPGVVLAAGGALDVVLQATSTALIEMSDFGDMTIPSCRGLRA
jgi:hypothetical protein